MASLYSFVFIVFLSAIRAQYECNHYYDKPIDVCFSAYSSITGLLSFKYSCVLNGTDNSITLETFNTTASCNYDLLINSTVLYNLTTDDINGTGPDLNSFVSCRAYKSCPYFRGRYYITKILTDAPTINPTVHPSTEPTVYPSTTQPSFNPSSINATITSTIDLGPYLLNDTCARTPLNEYYQEIVYLIDVCIPYDPEHNITNTSQLPTIPNDTVYTSNVCNKNPYGNVISISRSYYLNETCNHSMIENTSTSIYNNGECYNFSVEETDDDLQYILFDSERNYFKFSILECNYVLDAIEYSTEYLFYEFDLIASWIIWIIASLMLIVYTIYIFDSCRTVKGKEQYKETGILILDDDFSESRLAVFVFQWFVLFCVFLNSSFGLVNAWSYVDIEDARHCGLMMSALDLSWHWGKGFLYLSLMSRIVLIMEGLSSDYEIPTKILKVFAFEIVAYFMITPIFDLLTTSGDHELYFFMDERSSSVLTVCGEVIEYWVSFLLFFGDLMLCSTTIGVYLYALGELVMNPIENQKLIDHLIRYAIFSIFPSIWIMIGNALWGTNYFSIGRYIDTVFCVFSIMFMLTICSSCYLQCCTRCHKRMRHSYIFSFMDLKKKFITKELNEIKNNPKYVLKSYDKTFDEKLTAILSRKNLAKHKSMDTYRQNQEIASLQATIRSKKKARKMQKRLQKQILGATVNLDDRDLQTMKQILTFKTNEKFVKRERGNKRDQSVTETEETSDVPSLGAHGSSRNRSATQKRHGLMAHLNPEESTLPQALTIAIHASVVDTAKHKKKVDERITDEVKETIKYKVASQMQEIWTKVDTYYDENVITFCRRSPTIYPGIAYKLSKAERFALKERQDEIEGNEYSKSVDHSDSADSDDDCINGFERERIWPKASRKYGQRKSLNDIYDELQNMDVTELDTIWDCCDRNKKRRIDYRASLVQLLGALFLLYFRKQIYGKEGNENDKEKETPKDKEYIQIKDQPPRFDELQPLLLVLAKYIRDALRKRKRKCLKKGDFQRNFMSKYLKDAIEKRVSLLEGRTNKLQSLSPQTSLIKLQSMTPLLVNEAGGLSDDGKIEEEEDHFSPDEIALLSNVFHDDAAAGVEVQNRISNYVPRESENKYGYRGSQDGNTEKRKMKIDEDMEALQKKRDTGTHSHGHSIDIDGIDIDGILDDMRDIKTTRNELHLGHDMDDTPQTAEMSMDIDALVAQITDIHNIEKKEKEEKKDAYDEMETQHHVKDNQGTEIIHIDVVTPRKSKLVVIDDKLIKTETLGFDEDLLRDVIDSMDDADADNDDDDDDDDLDDDLDDAKETAHNKENDTVLTIHQHADMNRTATMDWAVDAQLMDDVLDVTFAVDDSDEESP